MQVQIEHSGQRLRVYQRQHIGHWLKVASNDGVALWYGYLLDSFSFLFANFDIIQGNEVIRAHDKVEVFPEAKTVQENFLRLRELEQQSLCLLLLQKK